MNIDNIDRKTIEISRKYKLTPGTVKCTIFEYFEEGLTTREVYFLLEKSLLLNTKKERRTLGNNIRRYHYDWEKLQPIRKTRNKKT